MTLVNNRVSLVGRIGNELSLETIENSGDSRLSISLATDVLSRGSDRVIWHYIVCYKTVADRAIRHLSKGDSVVIEGYLDNFSVTDSDGKVHKITKVVCKNFMLVNKSIRDEK